MATQLLLVNQIALAGGHLKEPAYVQMVLSVTHKKNLPPTREVHIFKMVPKGRFELPTKGL